MGWMTEKTDSSARRESWGRASREPWHASSDSELFTPRGQGAESHDVHLFSCASDKDVMSSFGLRRDKPPRWFAVLSAVFGAGVGWLVAALAAGLLDSFAGISNGGLFVLLWIVAGVIFYAWPMSLVARSKATARRRAEMRERLGDLDYEPPVLPGFMTPSRHRQRRH